jgi:hypothetical protein
MGFWVGLAVQQQQQERELLIQDLFFSLPGFMVLLRVSLVRVTTGSMGRMWH